MKKTLLTTLPNNIPERLLPLFSGAPVWDSSCSPEARVLFIEREGGIYLKSAAAGTLTVTLEERDWGMFNLWSWKLIDKKGKTHTFDFKDVVYTDAAGEKTSMIDMILGSAEDIGIEFELKLIICEKDKPKPIAKGKVKSVFEINEDDLHKFITVGDIVTYLEAHSK